MMRYLLWPAICMILLSACGCASMPTQEHEAEQQQNGSREIPVLDRSRHERPVPQARRDAESPQAYAERFVGMKIEDQKKEHQHLMQSLNDDKSNGRTKLKAALVFAHPESRYRDYKRAAALLAAAELDKSLGKDDAALAAVLRALLSERQKLEESTQGLAVKLKQEQTHSEELQQRAESLQQKLEELKNIEKTMQDRSRGVSQ